MTASWSVLRLLPRTALAMGLAWVLSLPGRADQEWEDPIGQLTGQRQREAKACRQRLAQLELTRAQARRLVPILERAAALQVERYQAEAALLPEMIAAFTDFAAEDRLNQGFSRVVERRTARVSHVEKEGRDEFQKQIVALEEEAARILTPKQRKMFQASPDGKQPKEAKLRTGQSKKGGSLAAGDAANDRLAQLRKELEELRARQSPQPGPLARCLFNPASFGPLCQVAGLKLSDALSTAIEVHVRGTEQHPREQVEQQRAEVARLRKEINNWNLINGLHLGQDQIERIVALYDEAAQAAGPGRDAKPRGELLVSLERAVEEVLNLGQRQVVAEYKACLLPPRNLKDPVRVGQADDSSPYEQWLKKSRRLNGEALDAAVAQALEREAAHVGGLSDRERKRRAVLLREVAQQAGKLSDAEFELNKADLAKRIAPPDRIKELTLEIDALAREAGLPGRVANFMLNPAFVAQLRERGRQLADGVESKRVDLAAGPQAENCDRGCALPPKKGRK